MDPGVSTGRKERADGGRDGSRAVTREERSGQTGDVMDPEVSTGRKERADGGRDGPRGEHGKKGAGRQET